jgi:hypothetical protein
MEQLIPRDLIDTTLSTAMPLNEEFLQQYNYPSKLRSDIGDKISRRASHCRTKWPLQRLPESPTEFTACVSGWAMINCALLDAVLQQLPERWYRVFFLVP